MKQENQLQVFTNEKFGEVRTVTRKGEPWFVGKDMVECLGYEINDKTTYRKYVDKFCDKEDVKDVNKNSLPEWSAVIDYKELGQRGGYLINESGMYSLIFGSDLPQAKEFKRWVTSEVLPTLRKNGEYNLHNENNELQQIATNIFGQLDTKIEKLDEYYRPRHKTKLNINKFIKECLGDNATKDNCKKAKNTILTMLGNYSIYEEVPLDKLQDTNTIAMLYDICRRHTIMRELSKITNIEVSRKLCELLNNNVKGDIKYSPMASNDEIIVKQILDKRELIYNTIYLKDTIVNEYDLEKIVDIIYTSLGIGRFTTSYPSIKEIELYDEFVIYGWRVRFEGESLWFDGDEIYISDILSREINKDMIKFDLDKEESGYSSVIITKEGKFFDLEYTE